jgi:hypothetical protein
MKRITLVITTAAGVVALAAWQLAPAVGHGEHAVSMAKNRIAPEPGAPAPSTTGVPAANAGYVVHFDQKGRIVAETTPQDQADFNSELNQAINTSQAGLTEKPSPVAGGGTMIDLQGRFQSAATATYDKDGKLVVPCLTNEADVRAFTSANAANRAASKK